MDSLISEIKKCTLCSSHLPHGANPVFSANGKSKIIIIGQAPGSVVHKTGIPWDDKSGDRLRNWLGVTKEQFYNEHLFALIPMGFCYPGKGKTGDLPPRKECAPTWHHQLFNEIEDVKLILLVGSYAQNYYLGKSKKNNLTETVKSFHEYLPKYIPIPHPSPRNNIWLKRNPWFENELVPTLKSIVSPILSS